jgi:hypothetical protein
MAAAGEQFHNLGSFPVTTLQEFVREGRHMLVLQLQLHIGEERGRLLSESLGNQ